MTEDAFLKEGKRMTDEECMAHFKEKSASGNGSFGKETERLQEAIHDHVIEWFQKAIGRFFDSDSGKVFLKKHKDKSSDEMLEIFERDTNFRELLSLEVKRKINVLRGKIA